MSSKQKDEEKPLLNKEDYPYDRLTKTQEAAYAVGHFFNDLIAATGWNYLFFFMQVILKLPFANIIFFIGQICDGLTTPICGTLSDMVKDNVLGKRMPFYWFGTILGTVCFIPIMHRFWIADLYPGMSHIGWQAFVYYAIFFGLQNISWACVQNSHYCLVPSMSCSRKKRDALGNNRNFFTFFANLLILLIAFIFFQIIDDSLVDFESIAYAATAIGLPTTIFFMIVMKENKITAETNECKNKILGLIKQLDRQEKQKILAEKGSLNKAENKDEYTLEINQKTSQEIHRQISNQNKHNEFSDFRKGSAINTSTTLQTFNNASAQILNSQIGDGEKLTAKDWMAKPMFWHYGVIYMLCRLYCNMFNILDIYYLVGVLEFTTMEQIQRKAPVQVAIIPFILYISSTTTSLILGKMYQRLGRRGSFTVGAILCGCSAIGMIFMDIETRDCMYFIAILCGATQAICLNTAIGFVAEVVGPHGDSGAFVYGAYGLTDRCSTGIATMLISSSAYFGTHDYTKYMIALFPTSCIMLAWCLVLCGKLKDYGDDKKVNNKDGEIEEESETDKLLADFVN